MEIRIKHLLTLLFASISIICNGQGFELAIPNSTELKEELRNRQDYVGDPIYLYLLRNYKPTSDQMDAKNYEFPDYSICSFTQNFENEIVYKTEHCQEGKGISCTLILPKMSRENLERWIEGIYQSDSMAIPHDWNEDRSEFRPLDSGAGCYYEIIEEENRTIVKSYCGC